eukprot:scaffold230290_cov19-Prasinocladus_malaysianus.AAC.1
MPCTSRSLHHFAKKEECDRVHLGAGVALGSELCCVYHVFRALQQHIDKNGSRQHIGRGSALNYVSMHQAEQHEQQMNEQ